MVNTVYGKLMVSTVSMPLLNYFILFYHKFCTFSQQVWYTCENIFKSLISYSLKLVLPINQEKTVKSSHLKNNHNFEKIK